MSEFRVIPDALRRQRDELDAAYRCLCLDIAELGGIIQQLGTMSSFDVPIQALRRVQRTGGEQQAKLRQSASVLDQVAELYTRTELKNLDGFEPGQIQKGKIVYRVEPAYWATLEAPVMMVPNAEALYGTEVVIQRED